MADIIILNERRLARANARRAVVLRQPAVPALLFFEMMAVWLVLGVVLADTARRMYP